MIDAGIHEGDVVVVEKRSTANIGEIVVAIIDNEFTLKRLQKVQGKIVLKPENKAYPVIRPKGDLEIFGVVVGQFRKNGKSMFPRACMFEHSSTVSMNTINDVIGNYRTSINFVLSGRIEQNNLRFQTGVWRYP